MASWLLPALKAVLPHVGSIVAAAKPAFSRRGGEATGEAAVQQQVAELQAAVTQNAENVRELAQQLRATVTALEQAAALAEARLRRAVIVSALSLGVSLVAAGIAIAALVLR
jgi:TolA-binding protein